MWLDPSGFARIVYYPDYLPKLPSAQWLMTLAVCVVDKAAGRFLLGAAAARPSPATRSPISYFHTLLERILINGQQRGEVNTAIKSFRGEK